MALPGVFCLEGEWTNNLAERPSVIHHLRTLEALRCCRTPIHRDVASRADFDFYVTKWKQKQYAGYNLGYFAFHGDRNNIDFGREQMTLEEMARTLRGAMSGRILYFGSCRTLAAPDDELKSFCKITDAKAVVGYTKAIGWAESAAFDLILLPDLLDRPNVMSTYSRLTKDHSRFVRGLGLRCATKTDCSPLRIARAAISGD